MKHWQRLSQRGSGHHLGPIFSVPCCRREREATYCNSMELRGMDSSFPHLKDSRETLIGRLMDALSSLGSKSKCQPRVPFSQNLNEVFLRDMRVSLRT